MKIRNGRTDLSVTKLEDGGGPAVLLLHELFGSSRDFSDWVGLGLGSDLHALDFAGHGDSACLSGGAYSPEVFASDADCALAALGPAFVVGRGLGAYVALLLAGARPDQVPAALLLAGNGLDGLPDVDVSVSRTSMRTCVDRGPSSETPDALLHMMTHDIRPARYAHAYAERANRIVLLEDGSPRPPWWTAVGDVPGVESAEGPIRDAMVRLLRQDA